MKCEKKHKTKKGRKKRKQNQINGSINLPRNYPWQVLRFLQEDLADFLTDSENKRILDLCRSKDLVELKQLSEDWGLQRTNPGDMSLYKFRAQYQISALLKSYQFSTSDDARKEAALTKFYKAESICKRMNHVDSSRKVLNYELDESIWEAAKAFIIRVLGEELPGDDELFSRARHGPGSNLDTKNGNVSPYYKYSSAPYSCTLLATDAAKNLIRSDERWYHSLLRDFCEREGITNLAIGVGNRKLGTKTSYAAMGPVDWEKFDNFWPSVLKIVPGNKISFVPKNAFTERTIAIEPAMNLMLQLGVDGFIRKRLKRYGVDLDSQDKNQLLARRGSQDDSLESFSTLDLSMASDTISVAICRQLLPSQWFDYLMKIRSPEGTVGEETISYEKISSMGNGCTFAIESLIFASLCYGVMRVEAGPNPLSYDDFACFGDDLIVKTKYVGSLISILRKSGFALNVEKSFERGPIRESCGADWLSGQPVRPVLIDGLPKSISELWADINRLQRILELRFGITLGESSVYRNMTKWIPGSLKKFTGPASDEEMDTYLHMRLDDPNCCYWVSRTSFSHRFQKVVPRPVSIQPKEPRVRWQRLMHDLGPYRVEQFAWYGDRTGKRFEVISRNRIALAAQPSTPLVWEESYHETGAAYCRPRSPFARH
jgi:hypothetical protein